MVKEQVVPRRVAWGLAVLSLVCIGVALSGSVVSAGEVTSPTVEGEGDSPTVEGPMHSATIGNEGLNYTLLGDTGEQYTIAGPIRETTTGSDTDLFVDESLFAAVQVRNEADTTETYDVELTVAGEVIDEASGELTPGESTTVTLGAQFGSPGIYSYEIAGEEATVNVHEEGSMLVTEFSTVESPIEPDEEATVVATVQNDLVESTETIEIEYDDETLTSETVTLDPGETTTIEASTTLSEPGVHIFTTGVHLTSVLVEIPEPDVDVDDVDVDVDEDVDEADTTDDIGSDEDDPDEPTATGAVGDEADDGTESGTDTETSDGFGNGFGVLGIVVASALFVALVSRRP